MTKINKDLFITLEGCHLPDVQMTMSYDEYRHLAANGYERFHRHYRYFSRQA